MAWTRYTYTECTDNIPPLKKPKRGEDSLEMLDRLGLSHFPDDVLAAAGFGGYDVGELDFSCLAKNWNGHAKGSRLISCAATPISLGISGSFFAIETPTNPAAERGRKGGSVSSKAKREAAKRNIEKRWADRKKEQDNP